MPKYNLIIFDLDGTLLDTSEGIYKSVRYAETKMGFLPIDEQKLHFFIGPPPVEMYKKIYGVDDATAQKATSYHREYGRTKAIYEAIPYKNIRFLLAKLCEKSYKLAVATLKQQEIAETLLEMYDLKKYFNIIVGMNAQETYTKSFLIEQAIKKAGTNNAAVMIGDTVYDEAGAREVGIDFISVSYGFGFSNAEALCSEPLEILNCLGYN